MNKSDLVESMRLLSHARPSGVEAIRSYALPSSQSCFPCISTSRLKDSGSVAAEAGKNSRAAGLSLRILILFKETAVRKGCGSGVNFYRWFFNERSTIGG